MKQPLIIYPYWRYKLKNFKTKKKNIKESVKKFPLEKKGVQNYYTNTFLFSCLPYKHLKFKEQVTSLLSDELSKFTKDIKKNIEITKGWIVNYKKGNDQIMHHHGDRGFTAILFIDFDPKKHSPVIFKKPFPNLKTGDLEFTAPYPNIEEGDLIIFPACIEHFAPVNQSEKDRMVLGFDIAINETE